LGVAALRPRPPGRGHGARVPEPRTMTANVVFWLAAAVLAYTWIGYPLLLRALAMLADLVPRSREKRMARPSLSVIVAAYNEAACIRAKIDSTLAQRYPDGRLEVIVVSDGSTDVTDAIVASHPDPRVRLIRQEPRAGKSPALNRGAVAALAGCESRFEPEAYTVEPPSHDGGQEFRRHTRIVAQGMHLLRRWLPALLAARRWRAVWMLLSHRALRWLNAPALAALLAASAWLAPQSALYAA